MKNFHIRSLVIADTLALWLALLVAAYAIGREIEGVRFLYVLEWRLSVGNVLALGLLTLFWLVINQLLQNYRDGVIHWREQLFKAVLVAACGAVLLLSIGLVGRVALFTPKFALFFAIVYVLADVTLRYAQMGLWSFLDPERRYVQHVVVMGDTPAAEHYRQTQALSATVVIDGYFAAAPRPQWTEAYLGAPEAMDAYLDAHVVDAVFVALPLEALNERVKTVLRNAQEMGIEVLFPVETLTSVLPLPVPLAHRTHLRRWHDGSNQDPQVALAFDSGPQMGWSFVVKRLIDIVGAASALVVLSPLLLAIALAIRVTMGSPVLFVQPRLGYHRRVFQLYKFRTMIPNADAMREQLRAHNDRDGAAFKMKNDPRVTPLGRWLRKLNLDELPQLFNVLKGDMSLVGPRPLPLDDYARIDRRTYLRRLSVLPGITCTWQISDRERITFDEWMRMDLEYIDHWSLARDIQLLFQTVWVVIAGRGDR